MGRAVRIDLLILGRSREGAWIEMISTLPAKRSITGRSREGAWIEIKVSQLVTASTVGRSREGAWIEIASPAPFEPASAGSLPRGSVD